MARPVRIEYEGAVYHVTIRGNNRNAIFAEDSDRERFLVDMEESIQRFDVRLFLFCLMTNHVHLVLETPRANLSSFMHRLQTAYTVYFNRKHHQSGHLTQGRFGAAVVDEDEYILKLSRYVHLNPVFVRAYQSKSPRERIEILRAYPWSSYRSYVGLSKVLSYMDYSPVLAMMDGPKKRQPATYRRFVESGITDIDAAFIEAKQRSRLCVGSEACYARVRTLYDRCLKQDHAKEDVSFRRVGRTLPVDRVLDCVCEALSIERGQLLRRQRNSWLRAIAAKALCDHSSLTQRQAAEALGMSTGVAVSRQLHRLSRALQGDKGLQKQLGAIRNRVDEINIKA